MNRSVASVNAVTRTGLRNSELEASVDLPLFECWSSSFDRDFKFACRLFPWRSIRFDRRGLASVNALDCRCCFSRCLDWSYGLIGDHSARRVLIFVFVLEDHSIAFRVWVLEALLAMAEPSWCTIWGSLSPLSADPWLYSRRSTCWRSLSLGTLVA